MMTERAEQRLRQVQQTELDRLRRLVTRDELTGLANRRAFLQRLGEEMARARRHGTLFSLVLLDLDGLKDLNDTFGHQAGDAALKHFARALSRSVRQEDLVARIGGDEFAVIAVHSDGTEAQLFAERIRQVAAGLARRVVPRSHPVWLSAAWGATVWDSSAPDVESLFARAETALIEAKQSGRGPTGPTRLSGVSGVYQPRGRRALGEELRRLLAMARDVSSARELQALCRAAAQQAAELIGACAASVALRGPDGRTGYTERYTDGVWLPANEWYRDGEGLIGTVMLAGEAAISHDAARDPRVDQDAVRRLKLRTIMCIPLRGHSGRMLGVLSLSNKYGERNFTSADVELGTAFGDLVATAIENVRAREEVEEAHNYLHTLMDQAHDAIFITHPDTRAILYANAAAELMTGYSRDELLTLRAPDLRPPEDRALPGTTDMVAQTEGVLTLARRHMRKDGVIFPVEVSARRVSTTRGPVIVHIVRDVSARVAAEESLRRQNRELQSRNDVAAILSGSTGDTAPLVRTLEVIVETLATHGAAVLARDRAGGAIRAVADHRIPEPLRSAIYQIGIPVDDDLFKAALAGQVQVVDDVRIDPRGEWPPMRASGLEALAIVPMRAHGEVVGVLIVGSVTAQRFGAAESTLLQSLADQIALWMENQRLLAEARRREQDARFMAELGDALNRPGTLKYTARLLTRRVGAYLRRTTIVCLRDSENGPWEVIATRHIERKRRAAFQGWFVAHPPRSSGGLMDLASRSSEPLLIDLGAADLPARLVESARSVGAHTLLLAPLRLGAHTLGVLIISGGADRAPLTERDRQMVAEICRHAAVAVSNAVTRRNLLARNRELQLMNQITTKAQRATTATELYETAVRLLHRAFPSSGAVLRIWDEEIGGLRLAAATGFPASTVAVLAEYIPRLGERLVGRVALTREPLVTNDLETDPRLTLPGPAPHPFRAAMVAPLLVDGRLVGTLAVVNARPGRFTPADLRLLTRAAEPLAAALARLEAYERAERAGRYARALFDSVADAIFVLDPGTHRIVDTNPAAERLTGYTRAELLRMMAEDLCSSGAQDTLLSDDPTARLDRFMRPPLAFLRRKDGREIVVEVSTSTVQRPDGPVVLTIVRDSTGSR